MKKSPETTLTVLKKIAKDISEIKSAVALLVASDTLVKSINETPPNSITVDFPAKTMQEIYKETNNKAGTGKLLHSTGWYEKEDFFTKDKCRPGKRIVSLELAHKGKSWDECDALKGNEEMLSPAEVTYLLAYVPEYREVLKGWKYTWTSRRASDGSLVRVGDFGDGGARVGSGTPDYRGDGIGVSFSRSE